MNKLMVKPGPKWLKMGTGLFQVTISFDKKVIHVLPIQCALDSPRLVEYFKCLERYHTTLTKFSRATQSQKVHEKSGKSQKFRMLILDVQTKVL